MPEKHEFDVRTLRRGSQSSELERHSLPPDTYDSPRPSVSPPPYCVQDEYPPCDPGHLSTTDDPSNEQLATTTKIHDPERYPQVLQRRKNYDTVNLTYRPGKQPPNNKIGARRNRGHFRSEIWKSSEETPRLRTIQTSKPRRYFSRTFPADSLTQPHLDQCYNRAYGFCLRTPLQEEHENTKSAQDLCLELDHLQKQIRYLKSAVIPVEKEFHSPAVQLPKYGNDDPQSEILIMAERERMISQRMQWLQNQLVIIWREIERTERAHKYTVEELTRVSDSNDRLAQPFRDMARAMNERNLGRRWLQGKIPWADAVHIGSEVPDFAMILTRERVMTEGL
ncbi:hypothetical protein ACHAQE_006637 [Botrytis cinerea]